MRAAAIHARRRVGRPKVPAQLRRKAKIALHILRNVEEQLAGNPQMGRPGRVPGTREFVVPKTPFIVPYRVSGNAIQVLRVYHGARRWPDRF